ncbi:MAG: helix-turn-helix domain-containing protein, partial [Pseudoclavibacter sp.]
MTIPADATSSLCPAFLSAMEVLGKRWNGAIIQSIGDRSLRFGELKRSVGGISDAVLARRLAELQGCLLIERTAEAPSSPRGRYALTAKGRALVPALDSLTRWAEEWAPIAEPGTAAQPGAVQSSPRPPRTPD